MDGFRGAFAKWDFRDLGGEQGVAAYLGMSQGQHAPPAAANGLVVANSIAMLTQISLSNMPVAINQPTTAGRTIRIALSMQLASVGVVPLSMVGMESAPSET